MSAFVYVVVYIEGLLHVILKILHAVCQLRASHSSC